jgi:hypothetical protein
MTLADSLQGRTVLSADWYNPTDYSTYFFLYVCMSNKWLRMKEYIDYSWSTGNKIRGLQFALTRVPEIYGNSFYSVLECGAARFHFTVSVGTYLCSATIRCSTCTLQRGDLLLPQDALLLLVLSKEGATNSGSQWADSVTHQLSSPAWTLRSWVRVSFGACMFTSILRLWCPGPFKGWRNGGRNAIKVK